MRPLIVLLLVLIAREPRTATAQPGTEQRLEVEPITCWWRTSATSVRVGQTFTVVLTCSLLHTEAARVIADESRLEPTVVQLAPFEVVGGGRAKDVTTASRRFVQFTYEVRVLAENVFASEAALAPLEITYRVESRVTGGDSLAGRDLQYALPPLTMRVLSIVPDTADDIREAPVAAFSDIEDLSSRADVLRAAGAVLLMLGALLLVVSLVGIVRRRRARQPALARRLTAAVVLAGVRRELEAIREAVRASGWDADLAGRTLAALRIVAAYASGRPVMQELLGAGHQSSPNGRVDGRVLISGRVGRRAIVSAAVASTDDEELRDALARFAAARYGRDVQLDARLDETLDAVIRRADRLAADRPLREKLWARSPV